MPLFYLSFTPLKSNGCETNKKAAALRIRGVELRTVNE